MKIFKAKFLITCRQNFKENPVSFPDFHENVLTKTVTNVCKQRTKFAIKILKLNGFLIFYDKMFVKRSTRLFIKYLSHNFKKPWRKLKKKLAYVTAQLTVWRPFCLQLGDQNWPQTNETSNFENHFKTFLGQICSIFLIIRTIFIINFVFW